MLSIGGTQVATATIDPAIIDTTDEVGRATANFAVPAGTPRGATPKNANVADSAGSSVEFHRALVVTADPRCRTVAPRPKVARSPLVNCHASSQSATGSVPVLVTVTAPSMLRGHSRVAR